MKLKLLPFFLNLLKSMSAVKVLFVATLTVFLFTGVNVMAQNGWVRINTGGQVPGTDLKQSPDSASLSGWYSCSEGYSVYVNYVTDWNSEECPNWEPTMLKLEYALGGNNHIEAWWHSYTTYGLDDYLTTIDPVRAWCQGPTITPGTFEYDESACNNNGGGGGGGGECPCGDCVNGCGGGGGECTEQFFPGQCYETCVTIGDEEDPYTGDCIGCEEECDVECDPGTWVCI